MELLKEWNQIQKKRIIPQKDFYKLIIAAVIFFTLLILFDLPESDFLIHDGAVDEETGVVCLSGEYGSMSVVYMYTADGEVIGEFSFDEKGTRPQFNRIYSEDGYFRFFYHNRKTLYTIDTEGAVVSTEELSSNEYWKRFDVWDGWKQTDEGLKYKNKDTEYIYNDSNYFKLKFNIEDRTFSIKDSNGKSKELWTSAKRDADKQFENLEKHSGNDSTSSTETTE